MPNNPAAPNQNKGESIAAATLSIFNTQTVLLTNPRNECQEMADYSGVPPSNNAVQSLLDRVKRYNKRDRQVRTLGDKLRKLAEVLNSLPEAITAGLQLVVDHCYKSCQEFERSLEDFKEPNKGLSDLSKPKFREGNIYLFLNVIETYISVILVDLLQVLVGFFAYPEL